VEGFHSNSKMETIFDTSEYIICHPRELNSLHASEYSFWQPGSLAVYSPPPTSTTQAYSTVLIPFSNPGLYHDMSHPGARSIFCSRGIRVISEPACILQELRIRNFVYKTAGRSDIPLDAHTANTPIPQWFISVSVIDQMAGMSCCKPNIRVRFGR